MKNVKINPLKLEGEITVPSSKSACHRAVICAGLSLGESKITNVNYSQDIEATVNAMKNLGIQIQREDDTLNVIGSGKLDVINEDINCAESGSTLRFLIPLGAITSKRVRFYGRGKLVSRPLTPYYEIFNKKGVHYETVNQMLPLSILGNLKAGIYELDGDISSQFISGLMFALPLLDGDSKIVIRKNLESRGYVDMTLDVLRKFSIDVENKNYKEFLIKGNQKFKSRDFKVEGDFSQAAFWLVAGAIGKSVCVNGLNLESLQADKKILDIIRDMGGDLSVYEDKIISRKCKTKGIKIDASECPDLVPILATLGALSSGTTKIVNAKRLRIKESDRLHAMATELRKIGADIKEEEDGLTIYGNRMLDGGEVYSWNDHRIAMALAIASIKCKNPLIIKNSSCVKKSYPEFFSDFKKLGGDICEWSMGE